MTHEAFGMWVLKIRGGGVNLFFQLREEAEDFYSVRVSRTGLWLSGPRPGLIVLRWERFQGSQTD